MNGSKTFDSENVIAYELGYRGQLSPLLSVDSALYFSHYDDLYSSYASGLNTYFENKIEADSYGLEVGLNWKPSNNWRLFTGYSWQQIDAKTKPGSTDINNVTDYEKSTPEHQLQLRSYWDIRHDLEMDVSLYYSDEVWNYNSGTATHIAETVRGDLRLGWKPEKDVMLSIVGQNLFNSSHPEMKDRTDPLVEVPRMISAQLTYEL